MSKASARTKASASRKSAHKTSGSRNSKSRSSVSKPATRTAKRAVRPVVIDMHGHMVMPDILETTYEHSLFAKSVAKKGPDGKPEPMPEGQMRQLTDMGLRLKQMDDMGIDIQVISPSILHPCTYMLGENEALAIDRKSNDRVAETVAQHPGRLAGIGTVPLQNAETAAKELERAVRELGLKGVIIASNVNGIELGDPRHRPFWAKAQELGAAIFIHPAGNTDPKMKKHRMLISLGQPLEETFAISSLVYDGVMDEFPNLKIVVAHGGGFLPFYAGRYDWIYRTGYSKQLKQDFSAYLRSFYYDSVIFNPDMLEFLAHKAPLSHIMMGTDYPFGEAKPVEFVRRARKLSRSAQDGILGRNAAHFLGIQA
jgi:aminocarboxymuconate-semialdehyde decarboxylase